MEIPGPRRHPVRSRAVSTAHRRNQSRRILLPADSRRRRQNQSAKSDRPERREKGRSSAPAKAGGKTAAPATSEAAAPKAITIGKINLQNGNINFSDFFIKPNYSANLTTVQGTISELKPETPGDLDIQARLDNAAPVEIRAKSILCRKNCFSISSPTPRRSN